MILQLSGKFPNIRDSNWLRLNNIKEMNLNIGVKKDELSKVVEILEKVVANEAMLYQKTKLFHWNVTGPQFIAYHELFDKQAEKIEETIDEISERIRSLGFFTKGIFSVFLKDAEIKEEQNFNRPALDMIKQLTSDHEIIIRLIRENLENIESLNDAGTADFLTAIMEAHEKEAWFLRAHLE